MTQLQENMKLVIEFIWQSLGNPSLIEFAYNYHSFIVKWD